MGELQNGRGNSPERGTRSYRKGGQLKAAPPAKISREPSGDAILYQTMKISSHRSLAILLAAVAAAPFSARCESSPAVLSASGRFIDTTVAKAIAKPQPLAPIRPNPIVQAIPREIVAPLPEGITRPLARQIVRSLPGQMIQPLPGQIVRALPGQIIHSLPGQIVQ